MQEEWDCERESENKNLYQIKLVRELAWNLTYEIKKEKNDKKNLNQ